VIGKLGFDFVFGRHAAPITAVFLAGKLKISKGRKESEKVIRSKRLFHFMSPSDKHFITFSEPSD
jgi:hypothetical protein